jgi:hypothetical protein
MKEPANFFKHARCDFDANIEFKPALAELFFMYSIMGVHLCGERLNEAESCFLTWVHIHKPHLLTDSGRKFLADSLHIDEINKLKSLSKEKLFQTIRLAYERWRCKGQTFC